MAFDGVFLAAVIREMSPVIIGARVDKIYQPSKEEIVIQLRFKGGSEKLYISAGANSPRVHLTKAAFENPKAPPMFCMLMRKHLNNGKLIEINQTGLDRIVSFIFESVNELGDLVKVTLCAEIMGRHSNLIMINQEGKVIDSIKRIDSEMSNVRRILPGITYELPPLQPKINILECDVKKAVEQMRNRSDKDLAKTLLEVFQGFSPLLCREAVFYAARGSEIRLSDMDESVESRLVFFINDIKNKISSGCSLYCAALDKNNKPKEYTICNIMQYGRYYITKNYTDSRELLDEFYSERDRIDRMKQRSHDLLKLIVNTSDRISRKLALQKQELSECGEREKLKICGDIINANIYSLSKGMKEAELINFYDENGGTVKVKLDPSLSPVQNAQKYYKEYRKAATAEKKLSELIAQAEQELIYIDSVFDAVLRTSGETELEEIRSELAQQGYIKRRRIKSSNQKPLKPLEYRSTDGFLILCGRNNIQNDKLTLKTARGNDIWCHTHNIPGSHVVIISNGKEIPDSTIEQACMIAAYNSKARESAQVPVDYTQVRYVKKPAGAKPGMVIFENNKTAFITADQDKVSSLAIDTKRNF